MLTCVCSTDSLAAAEPTDVTTDEASEIATGSGTQSMSQEEDWEDLADTKVCSSLICTLHYRALAHCMHISCGQRCASLCCACMLLTLL